MKERLDILLVKNGFFEDIERAKRAILAGMVIVNEQKIDKVGTIIKLDKEFSIRVKGDNLKYVSRGGLKLEKAIKSFGLDIKNKRILDVGASTGGFTDCALQNGAAFVYAVDVGTNQLDWKLRRDSRVKSIENTHIKDLTLKSIDNEKVDFIVVDVSFISIKKILLNLKEFCKNETKLMILIKPQFEASKEMIKKGGIIKDKNVHLQILEDVLSYIKEHGFILENLDFSPITGTKGNVEYISLIGFNDILENENINIENIIENSHNLGGKYNEKHEK